MDNLSNFNINANNKLSIKLKQCGVTNFQEALNYIQKLPYGRNSNRYDLSLVLSEQKGACSTKHAFLAEITHLNNIPNIQLFLGIYKMTNYNTKGIGELLEKHKLPYLPEAHCYLKINQHVVDMTRYQMNQETFETSLIVEEEITPKQIAIYKVKKHQAFLKAWISSETIKHSFNEVWAIRETCIKILTH